MNKLFEQSAPRNRQLLVVYLILMGLTFLTFAAGSFGFKDLFASITILFIALFKGYLIGDYFMLLKGIRSWWRWVILIWLAVVGILVALAFVLTPSTMD